MVLFHSRPIAPTRRLALGRQSLPCDGSPGPGFGGLLLGAVCARFAPELSDGFLAEVVELTREMEQGLPVAQPRLRHRLQQDRVGLTRSRQRIYATESLRADHLLCEFESSRATPSQLVLGAAYAAGTVAPSGRGRVLRAVRRGLAWPGDIGPSLFSHLGHRRSTPPSARAASDPVGWALEQLGFDRHAAEPPSQSAIQRSFRSALRAAHPDLGGADTGAAERIADLSAARRILLAL